MLFVVARVCAVRLYLVFSLCIAWHKGAKRCLRRRESYHGTSVISDGADCERGAALATYHTFDCGDGDAPQCFRGLRVHGAMVLATRARDRHVGASNRR